MYFNYNFLKKKKRRHVLTKFQIVLQFRPMLPFEHFDSYIPDWISHIEAVCIEHVRLIPPPCSQYAQHNEMYKEL
jgi:hypothetical protein